MKLPRTLAAAALAALLAACGPSESNGLSETAPEKELGDAISALTSTNGMSMNGMSMNGMSMNGMSMNGLTLTAMGTSAFKTWFNGNVALNAVTMKYTVRCALGTGKSYAWTNPTTGVKYTWAGGLGLAPGWTAGSAISVAEQQLVSACMAAHVNKFGLSVAIAIEGSTATGAPIAMDANELGSFPYREACFFGNLFNSDGIYAGIDHGNWGQYTSTFRGCVFDYSAIGTSRDCPPVVVAGVCDQICVKDSSQNGYLTCSYGGKTFKALATRIQVSAMSTCGDLRCDPAEKCGTGTSWNSCSWDCGACR